MKLLHTADWHVGKTLHRHQRLEEAEEALDEVIDIAEREEVDIVLVCGDVFENLAPSAEAERIVWNALLALRATGAEVLVLPGNHDNPRRFGAVKGLAGAAGIHVVPDVRRPSEGGVIELSARAGKEKAQIAVLPWVTERLLFGAEEMMGLQAEPQSRYADELPRLASALCAELDPATVTILAGHLFVSGARVGGGERTLTLGETFAVSAASLPTTVQYIALGHVHRPQDVPGAATPARYAGSLLQLDFGEREQEKSVTLVDAAPGLPAQVRQVPLKSGKQLIDVRGTLDELSALTEGVEEAWLRVTLVCDGPSPGLGDEVRAILPNALDVRLEYEREDPERRASELRRLTPRELFERYFQERHGAAADKRVLDLFDELLEEVTGASA